MFRWLVNLFRGRPVETQPTAAVEESNVVEDLNVVVDGRLTVHSVVESETGEIRVDVEYDATFVQSLRKLGYQGSDDQIVSGYVSDLHKSVSDRLADNPQDTTYD